MWSGTLTAPRPVDDMLALLSLEQRADVRMLALSGGETRRVDLACTLMGDPELVILDEPTTGLDPESRREVWRLVSEPARRRRDGAAHHALPRGGRGAGRPAGDHARRPDRPVGHADRDRGGPPVDDQLRARRATCPTTSPASAASSTSTGARRWRPTRCRHSLTELLAWAAHNESRSTIWTPAARASRPCSSPSPTAATRPHPTQEGASDDRPVLAHGAPRA